MDDELDNLVWYSLTTVHARFAIGHGLARRYPSDVTVFVGLANDEREAWDALATTTDVDETVIVFRAGEVEAPPGWERVGGGIGNQMVLTADPAAGPVPGIVALAPHHVPEMLDLVQLTQPGPFRPRTIELGNYYGVFEDGVLIAMAGERLQTSRFTEVSAVATHPMARGRGLASALTAHVARGILDRGQTPVLHVAQSNPAAQRVYERLGFVVRCPVVFAAMTRAES